MPQQIRAVVVDPSVPGRLAIREVSLRDPDRDELGVRVTAISLNRGETRRALQVAEVGWRPRARAAAGRGPRCGGAGARGGGGPGRAAERIARGAGDGRRGPVGGAL